MNEYEKLKRIAERLRESYTNGTRVELITMNDEQAVPSGTRGTVICVDDMATIHIKWDNGSSLGVVYGEDKCRKLTQKELEESLEEVEKTLGNDIGFSTTM